MPDWEPEIAVDRALAEGLLRSAFPELELRSLELIGEGWDNTVWLVDGKWVFRFPRREIAIPGVLRELDVLPVLAPLLPAPVPVPVYGGEPGGTFPWPFFGAALIPGAELGREPVDEIRLARDLGAFLRALHGIEPPPGLRVDPNYRSNMKRRTLLAAKQLATVEELGLWSVPAETWAFLEEARGLAPATHAVLVHGDLHFRHLLVEHARLAGVIDWGDVAVAASGIDLLLYWSAFGAEGRAAFLAAYGPIAEDDLIRARVLAYGINAILAEYGHREEQEAVRDEALASLVRTARG